MPPRLPQLPWHCHKALIARIIPNPHHSIQYRGLQTTIQRNNSAQQAAIIALTPNLAPNLRWRSSSVLDSYVDKPARPISLRQLIFFGGRNLDEARILNSANYVRSELPTRIARESPGGWASNKVS